MMSESMRKQQRIKICGIVRKSGDRTCECGRICSTGDGRLYVLFNPFSVEILRKVMARILESYYAEPRRIQLFFYYPSDEYISYLMTVEELMFTDEIVCMDLFPEKIQERRLQYSNWIIWNRYPEEKIM